MSQSSGAPQWRHICEECGCKMHSEVTAHNAVYFIDEGRVDGEVSEEDLRERLDETDGNLIVCNYCGSLSTVNESESDETTLTDFTGGQA